MKYKVIVTDSRHRDYEIEKNILEPIGATVQIHDCKTDEQLIEVSRAADALLVNLTPITAQAIKALNRCRVISRYGVGYDNVDLAAANQNQIYVANVPDYCAPDVAEHSLALLFACLRQVVSRMQKINQGQWDTINSGRLYRLQGRTFGFVGFGRTARALYQRLQGFGLDKILVYNPHLNQPPAGFDVELADLPTLLQQSDFLSINAPLTAKTHHLLGQNEFAQMKETAIIINTARGGIIVEDHLVEALKQQKIRAAGLDVFEQEPLPHNSPLRTLDNVVLSDHCAYYTEESLADLKTKAALNIKKVLCGEAPLFWVNRDFC
jgi:D-3-phosphoglycerate dehydrogenase